MFLVTLESGALYTAPISTKEGELLIEDIDGEMELVSFSELVFLREVKRGFFQAESQVT